MNEAIYRKLMRVQDLATLPEVMTKVLETIEDERSSARDVTALLERDHAISARVLRMANSAFYGLRHEVDSIHRAVVVIGFEAVRDLALATSVVDVLAKRPQAAFDPEDFWMHSLGAAKAAHILCQSRVPAEKLSGVFTTALLHDLGKSLLAVVLEEEYWGVVQTAKSRGALLRDIERERLDTDHAEVGAWIAKKWHFPPMIRDVIGSFYKMPDGTCEHDFVIAGTALASDVSCVAGFGCAGDYCVHPNHDALLTLCDLDETKLGRFAKGLGYFREEMLEYYQFVSKS